MTNKILLNSYYNKPVEMPDLCTKANAQKYLGLDMDKLNTDKDQWLKNDLPQWLADAKERESQMPEPKRIK
ncbi:MAG: hypothetical protein JXR36_04705 [Bacteroidales bacterium]|nr:hypothetical protein [Bacteroidales bacterium]